MYYCSRNGADYFRVVFPFVGFIISVLSPSTTTDFRSFRSHPPQWAPFGPAPPAGTAPRLLPLRAERKLSASGLGPT